LCPSGPFPPRQISCFPPPSHLLAISIAPEAQQSAPTDLSPVVLLASPGFLHFCLCAPIQSGLPFFFTPLMRLSVPLRGRTGARIRGRLAQQAPFPPAVHILGLSSFSPVPPADSPFDLATKRPGPPPHAWCQFLPVPNPHCVHTPSAPATFPHTAPPHVSKTFAPVRSPQVPSPMMLRSNITIYVTISSRSWYFHSVVTPPPSTTAVLSILFPSSSEFVRFGLVLLC